MKLNRHREDVKYLTRLAENRLSLAPIAKRYMNLIRAFECGKPDRKIKLIDRVLKDAEE